MGKLYQVIVYGLMGDKISVDLCNTQEEMSSLTVLQLKEKILNAETVLKGQLSLRLIFADKNLDDDKKLLSSYGIQHLSVIQVVVKLPGGLIV
ncbi:uncharacterized protein zgc:194655 [Antennarius striatus]|uniref:uncharacterized protein zgc:194655 n=1 Tax=Antennarius striatus TaxID=241820 RepID=UPI0035AE2249